MTHFSIPFTRHPFDTLKTAFRAFIARTGFNQEEARFWHQGWLIDERDTLESVRVLVCLLSARSGVNHIL